ncbi:hypothetical protein AAZX31_09G028000 [Glycine max]
MTTSEMKKKKKVTVVSKPIGFGKSRLALEFVKRLNSEIVSADSVQVICTFKQTFYSASSCAFALHMKW